MAIAINNVKAIVNPAELALNSLIGQQLIHFSLPITYNHLY